MEFQRLDTMKRANSYITDPCPRHFFERILAAMRSGERRLVSVARRMTGQDRPEVKKPVKVRC